MAATPYRKVGSRRALVYLMLSEAVNSRRVCRIETGEQRSAKKTRALKLSSPEQRHLEGSARKRGIPGLVKRLATATGGFGVGIGNFEARLHQAVNIVNFGTGEIQSALHVNKDLDPIVDEHFVIGILLFLKTHL